MNLDNLGEIKKLDKKNINSSLIHFTDQCKQGYDKGKSLDISFELNDLNYILVCGMGGSLLGVKIVKNLYFKKIKIPFSYSASYDLPGVIDENSLVITISNSGNTEETLASYQKAKKLNAKIIGITTGGKLRSKCQKDGYPLYLIDDKELNPSSVPRVAVGFQIGALLGLFQKIGLIKLTSEEFLDTLDKVKKQVENIGLEIQIKNNKAKQIAKKIQGKIPIILASQHLFGTANSINNQVNESGKNFAAYFELPEQNHHQLEGLKFPSDNPDNLIYLLIESNLYHERIQKRYNILKNILKNLGIEYITLESSFDTKLAQTLDLFQLGGYFTYYLGLLNQVDPAPNPFVDEFKKQLGSYS